MTYDEAIMTLKKRGLWGDSGLVPALRLADDNTDGLRVGPYVLNADELEALATLLRGGDDVFSGMGSIL